jgi:hypothetical protein
MNNNTYVAERQMGWTPNVYVHASGWEMDANRYVAWRQNLQQYHQYHELQQQLQPQPQPVPYFHRSASNRSLPLPQAAAGSTGLNTETLESLVATPRSAAAHGSSNASGVSNELGTAEASLKRSWSGTVNEEQQQQPQQQQQQQQRMGDTHKRRSLHEKHV